MERKNGFVFYESWYDGAKELTPKHRGIYLEAIIKFGLYGEETELKGIEKALFSAIKPTIKLNKKQKDNGRKGGANQGNSNARKTTQIQPKNNPNSAIYLDDKDKDIDKDDDEDKDSISSTSSIDSCIDGFYNAYEATGLKDYFDGMLTTLEKQRIVELSSKNDDFSARFWEAVKTSNWLKQQSFQMALKNAEKVLDGEYRNWSKPQLETQPITTPAVVEVEEIPETQEETALRIEFESYMQTVEKGEVQFLYSKLSELQNRHGMPIKDLWLSKAGFIQHRGKWYYEKGDET